MKLTIILVLLTALPYPKGNAQCASGYRESGGYCTPMNDKSPDAVPKIGACPSGWMQSGGACIRNPKPQR